MKKRILPFALFCLFGILINSCKKENINNNEHSGVVFYPTNTILNGFRYNGLSVYNLQISFTGQQSYYTPSNIVYSHVNGLFTYDLNTQTMREDRNINADTSKSIAGTMRISADRYLGFSFNHHTPRILNGMSNYPLSLLLLDGKFNILKELDLPAGTVYQPNSFLKDLKNGTYLFTYYLGNHFSKNQMICVDENLNKLWEKPIETYTNPLDDYSVQDIVVNNNAIFILQNKINNSGTDYYRIKKYDLNGNFINASNNSEKGAEAKYISASQNGYIVLGFLFDVINEYTYTFTKFDNNNNIVLSKTILDNTFNNSVIFSNIICINDAYYFITYGGLAKMNSNLEIEWIKPVGYTFASANIKSVASVFDQICLVHEGDHIYYIANDYWDALSGITAVKLDLEGNIVKQ